MDKKPERYESKLRFLSQTVGRTIRVDVIAKT